MFRSRALEEKNYIFRLRKTVYSQKYIYIYIYIQFSEQEYEISPRTVIKTSLRVRHTASRQPYRRELLAVQRDLQYGDFGSHHTLEIESSNFLMMT
jgi:hypothetical protein